MKRPKSHTDNQLLASLKQIATILKDEGQPWETHCLLKDYWITAHNQVIGIGEKIKEDLYACPNAIILKEALAKCGQAISITQLEHKLSIKSDKFRALVPCLPPDILTRINPDAPVAQINDRLKASIMAVSPLALDDENRIELSSILIDGGSVTATDARVIIQHWHGIDLPPKLILPKAIIDPVAKNMKQLTQFGFSNSSCTFYYEDESWLKCQYFNGKWPEVNRLLDQPVNLLTLPENFFEAVKSLEPFSEDGFIRCDTNIMRSHTEEGQGATFEVYGLPKGPVFKIKQLKMVQPFMQKVDFFAKSVHGEPVTIFYGENVRGAIAGIKSK